MTPTTALKPTMNERQYPQLFVAAREAGRAVGEMAATMGWVKADMTIGRAATGYVNRLPLNNLSLEKELRDAYLIAAEKAAVGVSE